jgi:hypothetical protein
MLLEARLVLRTTRHFMQELIQKDIHFQLKHIPAKTKKPFAKMALSYTSTK